MLPAIVLITVLVMVMLIPLLGAGRSPHILYRPDELTMGFDDVRGSESLVEEVTKTLNLFLAHRTFAEQMGGSPRKAILFEGPPGTGKTYMAKAMAAEAGVPFLFVSSSAFQSMFYGQTNRKIRSYFKALRKHARREGGAIGFIEELDAIGGARGSGQRAGEGIPGVVNELLIQLQSFEQTPPWLRIKGKFVDAANTWLPASWRIKKPVSVPANILVIGATNRASDLDSALLRPGRFDRNIYFGLPSRSGRRDIIDYYLGKKAHDAELDEPAKRETLAALTAGYSPVMIEHLMDESLVWALRRGANRLSWNDLQHAKMTEEIGLAQPVEYTEAERRTIATHEAGHATVAWLVGKGRKLEVLTIIKRKDALGLLSHSEEEERFTKTKSEVRALIDIAFGGMVAEEIFFGEASTGVASDLQAATAERLPDDRSARDGDHPGLLGGHGVPRRRHRLEGAGQRRRPRRGRGPPRVVQGLGDADARRAPERGRGPARRPAGAGGAHRRRHPRGDQGIAARPHARPRPTRPEPRRTSPPTACRGSDSGGYPAGADGPPPRWPGISRVRRSCCSGPGTPPRPCRRSCRSAGPGRGPTGPRPSAPRRRSTRSRRRAGGGDPVRPWGRTGSCRR